MFLRGASPDAYRDYFVLPAEALAKVGLVQGTTALTGPPTGGERQ